MSFKCQWNKFSIVVVFVTQFNVRTFGKKKKLLSGMNNLIFGKYRDKMELTETWLSAQDFLPLVKASIHRYIILSLSEFSLFFSLMMVL